MTDLIIIGAGGWGREVAWTVECINAKNPTWNVLGLADDASVKQTGYADGLPLLGSPTHVLTQHPNAAIFLAIGNNATRQKLALAYPTRIYPTLIDPRADVAKDVAIGKGSYIGPHALVSIGVKLGDFVLVNARSGVGHDCQIDDYAQISPGATLSGATQISEGAFIGTNASTVPLRKIGAWAKVCAGVPVYTDLAPGATLSPFGVFRGSE